jgi:hypothetical protein
MGKTVLGLDSPATGSNLGNPVRLNPALGGQDLWSAVLLGFLQRQGRTAVATGGPRV